jgi:transcriptional regulator with XRE-family HTH domain
MSSKLGQLIKEKLAERRLSQRQLAQMAMSSPTYINYLIRGINPSARSGKLRPRAEIVKSIARVLGIPAEEALEAAGLDPRLAQRDPGVDSQVYLNQPKPVERTPLERPIFDIAYNAALAAVKDLGGSGTKPSAAKRVTIDIPGRLQIVLLDAADGLTPDQIAQYKQAFLAAYEAVRQQMDAERAGDT